MTVSYQYLMTVEIQRLTLVKTLYEVRKLVFRKCPDDFVVS